MKTFIAALLVALLVSFSSAQKPIHSQSTDGIEQELRSLTRKLDDAFVTKDFDTLNYILSDQYTLLGSSKESYLALMKSFDTTYEYINRDIVRVSVYDHMAVVSGLLKKRGGSRGVAPYDSTFSFADVWVRLQGRWQCISSELGNPEQKDGIRAGPELKASLVIYFKTGVKEDQITKLFAELQIVLGLRRRLAKNDVEICDRLRIFPALQNHAQIALTFCEGIAKDDQETIRDAIKSSSIVYRVLENTAPVEVKSIDE